MINIIEGWKTYADKSEISFGWSINASIASNSAFVDVSGRRTFDMYGSNLARNIPQTSKTCLSFKLDLTTGSISGSTYLFSIGLDPANISSTAYTSNTGSRFRIEAYGSSIRVVRQPYATDGSLVSGSQTVATATHNMVAGSSYRVEILADVSSSTGSVQVMLNGVILISAEFPREISSYACDSGFAILSLFATSTSLCRGRISDLVVYSDDATTSWPLGPINVSYMPVIANEGQTFSFPPALTDTDVTIDTQAGQTWEIGDISASNVKGAIASIRLGTPNAVTPSNARIKLDAGATNIAQETHVIQPGAPVFDHKISLGALSQSQLNALTLNIGIGS